LFSVHPLAINAKDFFYSLLFKDMQKGANPASYINHRSGFEFIN